MGPHNLIFASLVQFFEHFINLYLDEAKKNLTYSQSTFNKEKVASETKEIYEKLINKWKSLKAELNTIEEEKDNKKIE
jgi:hypothetical protein